MKQPYYRNIRNTLQVKDVQCKRYHSFIVIVIAYIVIFIGKMTKLYFINSQMKELSNFENQDSLFYKGNRME